MSEYTPDFWLILRIQPKNGKHHYRVFGTWSGSYLYGASWRMNSGIIKVEKEGDHYLFYGTSGSVYRCHVKGYGVHHYGASVLQESIDTGRCVRMDENTDWLNFKW